MVSKKEIQQYIDFLYESEVYTEWGYSYWPHANLEHGNSVCNCTTGANLICHKFGGKVYGYHIRPDEKYKNIIGFHAGGHDFAIVGEFLVDYWAKYVEDLNNEPILHLVQDMAIIKEKYLPLTMWRNLPLWEKTT